MASSLFGVSNPAPMMQNNSPFAMIGNIRRFAGMLRGRGDPRQLVMNYMQQNGIPQEQLNAAIQEAQSIAQMMGIQ